jgi:tRNA (guanine37-N1)-methyltransferase
MRFDVLTIFPELIESYMGKSILNRAVQKGLAEVTVTNIRDFATDKHKCVDDYPYGGGPGMVMKPDPVFGALQYVRSRIKSGDCTESHTIFLSPGGKVYTQALAHQLAESHKNIVIICGRYEGVDERICAHVDEEISIGDFVLTGGELAALVIIDSVVRLIPGVLGDERSFQEDSFSSGLLDYPHYTRPPEFMGIPVPEVLLSGHHREIEKWRRKESLKKTLIMRPYLLHNTELSDQDFKMIEEIKEEIER